MNYCSHCQMQKFFITHWFLLWPTIKPKHKVKKTKYPLFEINSSHWYCSQHLMYRYQVLTWWWRHILGNEEGHVTYSHNNSHEDRGDTARKSHPVSTYSTHNRCHLKKKSYLNVEHSLWLQNWKEIKWHSIAR